MCDEVKSCNKCIYHYEKEDSYDGQNQPFFYDCCRKGNDSAGFLANNRVCSFYREEKPELIAEGFKKYVKTKTSEMRPYIEGEDTAFISISNPDVNNGSPKIGDMIARNPVNHEDQWLVAEKFFKDNFMESTPFPSVSTLSPSATVNEAYPQLERIKESMARYVAYPKDMTPRNAGQKEKE